MHEFYDVAATILIFSVVVAFSFVLGAVSMALLFMKGDK